MTTWLKYMPIQWEQKRSVLFFDENNLGCQANKSDNNFMSICKEKVWIFAINIYD